ncbi:MAG: hypothetical protein ACLRVQ_08545, partial [Lachnospiraceae bacterium]
MKNTDTKEYLENYIKLIKKEALRLIKAPVPKATREAYMLYFETGSRLTFEKQYFAVREQLTVFGLMVSLWEDTGADKECAARLLHVIKSVLNENTWVLPAHGSREHIDGKVQSIDLFSAETGGSLSEILYLIKDNPAIR